MYLLGLDIGSSSVKASIVDLEKKQQVSSAFYPPEEMTIDSPEPGFAEQDPEMWWENAKLALKLACTTARISPSKIQAIGISYQMHGLVMVDQENQVIRKSIIWCDSRAVQIGDEAFAKIGLEDCLSHCLNSPGNFTASKLKWVKANEPELFARIKKIMLPGDFIALRLSGDIKTTRTGLSEGIMWDFKNENLADIILKEYGFDPQLIPDLAPEFGVQSLVDEAGSAETGIPAGTPISYRAGDQPNNALSLNVMKEGEVAAVAGTSGVIYAIQKDIQYDPLSRVNSFAHVNHTANNKSIGILLCINGTGILYSWLKRYVGQNLLSYNEMNDLAAKIPAGSEGISILPFGNGAERMLQNKDIGAQILGINFNQHNSGHLFRAGQEGIAFAFRYGLEILKSLGIKPSVMRVGNASMFQSVLFREIMANALNVSIESYNTDGALGAALAAGYGAGLYPSIDVALSNLEVVNLTHPDPKQLEVYNDAFKLWKRRLESYL